MIPLGGAGDIATARRDRGRYIIEQPVVEERTTDMTGIAPYALDADNAERLWEVSVRLLPAHRLDHRGCIGRRGGAPALR